MEELLKLPLLLFMQFLFLIMSKTHYSVNISLSDGQSDRVNEKTTFVINIINQSQRTIE